MFGVRSAGRGAVAPNQRVAGTERTISDDSYGFAIGLLGVANGTTTDGVTVEDRDPFGQVAATHTNVQFSVWASAPAARTVERKDQSYYSGALGSGYTGSDPMDEVRILSASRSDGYMDDGYALSFQGTRVADIDTAAWTTMDWDGGSASDVMSQQPYMWNRNNPIQNNDPSGYCTHANGVSDGTKTPCKIADVTSCTNPALPPCGDWTAEDQQTVENANNYISKLDALDREFVLGSLPFAGYLSRGIGAMAPRVFWSGGDVAKVAAREFARRIGGKTLEQTALGRLLEIGNKTPGLGYLRLQPLWDAASESFASDAQGTVYFIGNQGGRTFTEIEAPALAQNPMVNLAPNGFVWLRQ